MHRVPSTLTLVHIHTPRMQDRDDRMTEQERERKKCSNESMSRSCIYNFVSPSTRAIIQLNGNIRIYNLARAISIPRAAIFANSTVMIQQQQQQQYAESCFSGQ